MVNKGLCISGSVVGTVVHTVLYKAFSVVGNLVYTVLYISFSVAGMMVLTVWYKASLSWERRLILPCFKLCMSWDGGPSPSRKLVANTVLFCSFLSYENGCSYFLYKVISFKRRVVHTFLFIAISAVGTVVSTVQ